MKQEAYALSATLFAAIFLVSVIVYGGEWSRLFAIAAAFAATASQFSGQDPAAWKVSINAAYIAFALSLIAFGVLVLVG